MLFREPVQRWLAGVRPWMSVIAANGIIMTFFLWHLTAYFSRSCCCGRSGSVTTETR
jgi:hypothetical protein